MNNKRFATSLHILALLTLKKEERVCSDYIASSININPVTVRKELSNLHHYGFISTKEGKNGGTTLAKPADDISLADVYLSVRSKNILGTTFKDPNPQCPVGRQINRELEKLYLAAEDALLENLRTVSLSAFCKDFI
jgi:DNA-binding IscR family transcriptional regulator